MLRRLLNVASIVCLVMCVALMGLWVRSYRKIDWATGPAADRQIYQIASALGRLNIFLNTFIIGAAPTSLHPWSIRTVDADPPSMMFYRTPTSGSSLPDLGFDARYFRTSGNLQVPYWFLVFAMGSLAMLFQLRWPPQFTLRSMFIATTFLAIVLGMCAWLDHSWIGK
jgi:hypothetical protein